MSIDSISLLAQQSYTQIQNRPVAQTEPTVSAVNFQQMVNKQFNSFAKMTPEQILNTIQNAKAMQNSSNSYHSNDVFTGAVHSLRGVVSKQENTARKSLLGQASLDELLTTTTEAKNVMESTVRIRDKFLEAFDKVMNMSM